MKAAQCKASSGHSALEVRLNRAIKEVEKYKTELCKAQAESKVTQTVIDACRILKRYTHTCM